MHNNGAVEHSAEILLATVDLGVFGGRVRETRRGRGLTQQDLAGAEFTPAYVSRIEAGQRRPDLTIARLIAARLDTSLDYLVTGTEPRQAEETRLAMRYAELALKSGEAAEAETQLALLAANPAHLGQYAHEVNRLHALSLEAVGRPDDAIELLETLVLLPDGSPDLEATIALCRVYREAGDIAHAIEIGERGRQHATEIGLGGTDGEIRLTVTLVAAYLERGDLAHAAQLCRQVVARAQAHASAPARAAAYWNASILASKRAHHGEAVGLAERALGLLAEGGDERSLARLRTLLGLLSLRQDEPDLGAAHDHLTRAYDDLCAADGSPVDTARCQVGLAQMQLLAGDNLAAIDQATDALRIVASASPLVSANAQVMIGRAKFAMGDQSEAHVHFMTAAGLLTASQADRDVGQLWFELGELLQSTGDTDGAVDAFKRAAASVGLRSTARISSRL
jgi:transcriptional regulator with XRE-family HTH domain